MSQENIRLVVEIEKDLHRRLKVYVAQNDTSIREAVKQALNDYLNRHQPDRTTDERARYGEE